MPLVWYPRLLHGSKRERARRRLIGRGVGIHWPSLDEDISVEGLLVGRRSGESQESLKRWFERRRAARPNKRIQPTARRARRGSYAALEPGDLIVRRCAVRMIAMRRGWIIAMMDRRAFVGALAFGVLAAPDFTEGQKGRVVRIGVLRPGPDDSVFRQNFDPFRQTLRDKGFRESANLVIEYRVQPGSAEEIAALARELVRLNVDAILAIAPAGVSAAARATTSVPIVAVDLETDPIAAGLATGLARPGRNITGLFLDFPELSGKWIELLKTAVPALAQVAVLWDPATGPSLMRGAETAAPALRVRVLPLKARSPADFGEAFRSAIAAKAGAMLVLSSPVFNSARRQIAELAAQHRMPAIMPFTGFAEDGGLMAYGPHLGGMFRQAGDVMVNVLRGMRPGDIPIERPTRFELTVNLRTAKVLGLTVPPSVLIRADQVLE